MKFELNEFTLYRGQDDQILVALLDDEGNPVNISGASEVKLRVRKSDQSILEKTPITGMAVGIMNAVWLYSFGISAVESMNLALGADQTMEIKIVIGGALRFIPIRACLTVLDLPF